MQVVIGTRWVGWRKTRAVVGECVTHAEKVASLGRVDRTNLRIGECDCGAGVGADGAFQAATNIRVRTFPQATQRVTDIADPAHGTQTSAR